MDTCNPMIGNQPLDHMQVAHTKVSEARPTVYGAIDSLHDVLVMQEEMLGEIERVLSQALGCDLGPVTDGPSNAVPGGRMAVADEIGMAAGRAGRSNARINAIMSALGSGI